LEYYDELEATSFMPVFTIHRMRANYGHQVYYSHAQLLPPRYFLTDPDLQFPSPFSASDLEVMMRLSDKYSAHKVGTALDLSDSHRFIQGPYRELFMNCEKTYYDSPIENDDGLEMYFAPIDTTFCLVNCEYSNGPHIRIAGRYTAKHLPWYRDYLKEHVPMEELKFWVRNNISSSILMYLTPEELGIVV
jgi:hypothetical protein